VLGGFCGVGQHFEQAGELLHHGKVLSDLRALLGAVKQLAQRDGGNRHPAGVLVEDAQDLYRPPLDDVDDDVGIEQVLQHRLYRVRGLRVRVAPARRARP
jgi:hypothetical protein